MNEVDQYEPVLPYGEFAQCSKCGAQRGRSEKALMKFCAGGARPGVGPSASGRSDTCRYGPAEHLHHQCPWCQYEWSTETAEMARAVVQPLTNGEVLELRTLLASLRAADAEKPAGT